jgi:hypothetical protein
MSDLENTVAQLWDVLGDLENHLQSYKPIRADFILRNVNEQRQKLNDIVYRKTFNLDSELDTFADFINLLHKNTGLSGVKLRDLCDEVWFCVPGRGTFENKFVELQSCLFTSNRGTDQNKKDFTEITKLLDV